MMLRIWYIAWREYRTHLTRRSYLIFTFGFPLFMLLAPLGGGLILALALQTALPESDPRPVGLVDQPQLFAETRSPPDDPVQIILYDTPQEAATALEKGKIQAYYDIQPDYWQTGEVILTYDHAPTMQIDNQLFSWIRRTVRASEELPPNFLKRFDQGPQFIHQDLSGTQTYTIENVIEVVVMFMLIYFVRLGGSFTAEYMFGSIAREAQDRTLEILITSVSPLKLVLGKFMGLVAVGLTQMGVWGGVAVGLSLIISRFFEFDLLGLILGWEHLSLLITVSLAAYLMDQVVAATLGMFRVSGGAGTLFLNSLNWIVGLGLIYSIYFVPRNPHTFMAIATSIFPVTAPIVLLVRVVVSEVPQWQIVAAQIALWGTIIASIFWLRWLLQANLVSYAPSFKLRDWLGRKYRSLVVRK